MENVNEINSIEEVFEIMDGWKGKRQEYTEIVTEFLKTKERQPFYEVTYLDDPETNNEITELKALTDENVAEINQYIDDIIDREYPEEACNKSDEQWRKDLLSDVICDFSEKEWLLKENLNFMPMQVGYIDLNQKYYCYNIKVALFPDGMDNPPKILNWVLNLPDDKYIYLTAEYMVNPNFSFNKLRTKDKDMYNIICNDIEGRLHGNAYPCDVPTYAVEFTEIVEDAQLLLKSIENSVEY